MSTDPSPAKPERPDRELHTITDLRQVKVLADPLRLRILELLCQDARTTKQVAQILGEKPTKLYHHVEALEKVGLIELRRTRQNRGTLEKYYLAIARGFLADSGLFSATDTTDTPADGWQGVAANPARELRRGSCASSGVPAWIRSDSDPSGIIVQLKIQTSDSHIAEIQSRLESLLKEIQELDGTGEEGDVPYRMTLAFYPLEPPGEPDGGT